ncbi:MAG: hypothetical protein WA414_06480, partial [Acidobacteriaceae bacterium]
MSLPEAFRREAFFAGFAFAGTVVFLARRTAVANFLKFSPACGPSWYSCFICFHYPPESGYTAMLPHQFRRMTELLRSQFGAIIEA